MKRETNCKSPMASRSILTESDNVTLYHTITSFNDTGCMKCLLKTLWGKRENAGTQHFLHLPQQCFLPFPKQISLLVTFILSAANTFNLDRS